MAALDSGAQVSVSNLSGLFKEVYADKLQDLVPQFEILSGDVPFVRQPKLGDSYHFPIRVKRAHGVTFNSDGSAFELNSAIAGVTVDASVQGTEFVIRERVSYGAASRAIGSREAFESTFNAVVLDMTNSSSFYREALCLYGQSDIGTVSTATSVNATTVSFVISQATWAPGLWAQMEGAKIDLYNSAGGTKQNASDLTINSVNMSTRTLSVQRATADATETNNAGASSFVLTPKGDFASTFNVYAGLDRITTNTTSLFGVSAATYGIWQANTHGAGSAALTMAKVCGAAAEAAVRSEMGKRICYVSTASWTDLNNDHAALRRFGDSTRSDLDLGTQRIKYYGPTGEIEIVPHPLVKGGEAFLVDPRHLKRVGSTDFTFELPGAVEGQQPRFFQELDAYAGFELRGYWDQALISDRPAAHTKITSIVNSTVL